MLTSSPDGRSGVVRQTLVLSGGGSRGAMQVGALRALMEAGVQPDLIVGTSIGAVNGAFLAIHGWHPATLDALVQTWREAARAGLIPKSYLEVVISSVLRRGRSSPRVRMERFFLEHGLMPDLRFGDLPGARLIVVAADLRAGRTVLYGTDPEQLLMEALLATTALPPWQRPMEVDGRILMDGGVVSNLPIEAAIAQGATEIIALDLFDAASLLAESRGFGLYINRLMMTVEKRHTELELALARALSVPVRHVILKPPRPLPYWNFRHTDELINLGYQLARRALVSEPTVKRQRTWWERLREWWTTSASSPDRRSYTRGDRVGRGEGKG